MCFCFVYAHFYGYFLKLECYFGISAFLFIVKSLVIRFSVAYMSDYYRLTVILVIIVSLSFALSDGDFVMFFDRVFYASYAFTSSCSELRFCKLVGGYMLYGFVAGKCDVFRCLCHFSMFFYAFCETILFFDAIGKI